MPLSIIVQLVESLSRCKVFRQHLANTSKQKKPMTRWRICSPEPIEQKRKPSSYFGAEEVECSRPRASSRPRIRRSFETKRRPGISAEECQCCR